MNSFITETLPEDLSVLVFSQSPVLADLFSDQLEQHGLQVTRKSSDAASLSQFLEDGISPTWYKVFWIDDVTHLSIDQAKQITKIFQEIKGLSYVIMHQPYRYSGIKKLENIGNNLTEIDTFFAQRSPYTSILAYRDVLSNELFSLNYQQIIHFLYQKKFPLNQDILSFLSDKDVMEAIAGLCFDPRGGKRRVVMSKKPISMKTVLKALQTEFRRRFKGEEVFLQTETSVEFNPEFKEFATPPHTTQEEVVSELIVEAKFHYQPEKESRAEEYVPKDIPRPEIPIPKPVVKPKKSVMKAVPEEEMFREEVAEESEKEERSVEKTGKQEIAIEPEKKKTIKGIEKTPVKKSPKSDNIVIPTGVGAASAMALRLPLSQLVPKSIQETSIQVKVDNPVVNLPHRAPVLIPDTYIPEIRRSKIILHQLNSNLEKPVEAKKELNIPYLNSRLAAKVQKIEAEEKKTDVVPEIKHIMSTRTEPVPKPSTPEQETQKKMLEKKISTLFAGTLKPQKKLSLHREKKPSPFQILFGKDTKIGKWYKAQKGIFGLSSAVVITSVTLVGTYFFSLSYLQRQLLGMIEEFEQGTVIDEKRIARLAFGQNLVEKQLNVYSTVFGTNVLADSFARVEVSKKITSLTMALEEIHSSNLKAFMQFLGVETGDPVASMNPTLIQTETVYKELSLLEAELKQSEGDSFFHSQLSDEQRQDLIESLSEIRRSVLIGQQLTQALPNLLVKGKKKTIAIVLQDATELRATGGFVQNVALVTVSDGRVSEYRLLKPEEMNSNTGGQVVPPAEVKEYLGESEWFIRDGNWNPSFDITAKQLSSFIEKNTSTPVDAVIGMNTSSLAKFIGVVGPVTLSDLGNEKITDKNFADQQLKFAKQSLLDSEKGVTKPEFLATVFTGFLEKMKGLSTDQVTEFLSIASDQIKQDELVLFSSDSAIQSTLGALGWSGALITPPCPAQLVQEQCVVSSMFQVDSNVGVNKVNATIKKKVEHGVQITKDKIIHKRVITYENSGTTNSWPGGAYKNYIRWYVPAEAKLKIVTVNSKEVDPDQIKQYQEKNFNVFGTLVEVTPQTTTKVTIEYEEGAIETQKSAFVFFDQKQPGTGNTPTKITLFYDAQFTPVVIAPDAEVTNDKIEFSQIGDKHSFVGVKFK